MDLYEDSNTNILYIIKKYYIITKIYTFEFSKNIYIYTYENISSYLLSMHNMENQNVFQIKNQVILLILKSKAFINSEITQKFVHSIKKVHIFYKYKFHNIFILK